MAARAEVNGAPTSVTTKSSATIAASGMPGMTMTRTRTHLARSHAIITPRRGYRSASQASVTPPMKVGTMLTTNVTAASKRRTGPVVDEHGQRDPR